MTLTYRTFNRILLLALLLPASLTPHLFGQIAVMEVCDAR